VVDDTGLKVSTPNNRAQQDDAEMVILKMELVYPVLRQHLLPRLAIYETPGTCTAGKRTGMGKFVFTILLRKMGNLAAIEESCLPACLPSLRPRAEEGLSLALLEWKFYTRGRTYRLNWTGTCRVGCAIHQL
jgi:hypothetical protein